MLPTDFASVTLSFCVCFCNVFECTNMHNIFLSLIFQYIIPHWQDIHRIYIDTHNIKFELCPEYQRWLAIILDLARTFKCSVLSILCILFFRKNTCECVKHFCFNYQSANELIFTSKSICQLSIKSGCHICYTIYIHIKVGYEWVCECVDNDKWCHKIEIKDKNKKHVYIR